MRKFRTGAGWRSGNIAPWQAPVDPLKRQSWSILQSSGKPPRNKTRIITIDVHKHKTILASLRLIVGFSS